MPEISPQRIQMIRERWARRAYDSDATGELLDAYDAALARAERLERDNERLRELILALDPQLTRIEGEDGFIEGYQMKTGIWHKLLALARDPALTATTENGDADAR